MRNKVIKRIAGRMTALLLTLAMMMGTFGVTAFADDAAAAGAPKETVAAANVDNAKPAAEKKAEQPAQSEAPAKAEQPAQSEAPAKAERPAQSEASAKAEQPAQSEAPAKAEQPAQSEAPAKAEQSVQSEAPAEVEQPAQSDADDESQPAAEASDDEATEGLSETSAEVTSDDVPEPYVVSGSTAAAQEAVKANGSAAVNTGNEDEESVTDNTSGVSLDSVKTDAVKAGEDGAGDIAEEEKYKLTIDLSDIKDILSNIVLTVTVSSPDGIPYEELTTPDDGPYVNPFTIESGQKKTIELVEGALLIITNVEGLPDGYQQGNTPVGAKKQLKLVFDSGFRIALNNSDLMKNPHGENSNITPEFKMPAQDVIATVGTAYRIYVLQSAESDRGSCSVNNNTDKTSEWSDMFAMPGDNVYIDANSSAYEVTSLTAREGQNGQEIPVNNMAITTPSIIADAIYMTITYKRNYENRNVTVRENKFKDRGSVTVDKSQYKCGEKVVLHVKANKGYKLNENALCYIYTGSDGKLTATRITKDENGEYSFIMIDTDVAINFGFVNDDSVAKSQSKSSSSASYAVYAKAPVQEVATPEEEVTPPQVETLDVTPIVARVVAETVMTATVSITSLLK